MNLRIEKFPEKNLLKGTILRNQIPLIIPLNLATHIFMLGINFKHCLSGEGAEEDPQRLGRGMRRLPGESRLYQVTTHLPTSVV